MEDTVNLKAHFADRFDQNKALRVLVLVDEVHISGLLVLKLQDFTYDPVLCV